MNIQPSQNMYDFAINYWKLIKSFSGFKPDNFYILNDIPFKKLEKATEKYATAYNTTKEQIIFLANTTFLFTTRGILLTTAKLYGKIDDQVFCYELSEINDIKIVNEKNSDFKNMIINGKNIGIISYEIEVNVAVDFFFKKILEVNYNINEEEIKKLLHPELQNDFLKSLYEIGASKRTLFQISKNAKENEKILKHLKLANTVLTEYRIIEYFSTYIIDFENIKKVKFTLILPNTHVHSNSLLIKAAGFIFGQVLKNEALKNKEFNVSITMNNSDEKSIYKIPLSEILEMKEFLKSKDVYCDYKYQELYS